MFDRLKKVFGKSAESAAPAAGDTPLELWASSLGFVVARKPGTDEFSLSGAVDGRPFRLDRAAPSRAFIVDKELRARAELDVDPEVSVMVINRQLRDALEKKAYENYTDSLQTTLDTSMPEEVRWLAMYDEAGWETGAVPGFWERYSIVADLREHAQAWVGPELMQALVDWPQPTAQAQAPFIMMLQRGKLYLRMEFSPAELSTLQHATSVFTTGCAAALARWSRAKGP